MIISITSQRTGEIKRTTKREIKRERILERTPRKTNLYFANGCAILLLLLLLRVLLFYQKSLLLRFFREYRP